MPDQLLTLNPKKLGFGLMRLPTVGDAVDMDKTREMIDRFLDAGHTYFDTAYAYHGGQSESAVKPLLTDRYPRERFTLATKMPLWLIKEPADARRVFDTQLERTGAGYFDFYLLHALSADRLKICDDNGLWDFMRAVKAEGLARHIGFSFHDKADVLDAILTSHPEVEFVQLQINYADWDSPQVQSRLCYETARRHGKPVIIMEPLRGGMLTQLAPAVRKVFLSDKPDTPPAEWALRFAMGLDGVLAVLSGMSEPDQVTQNLEIAARFSPLDTNEQETLGRAVAELKKIDTIPCTACAYCVEGCPMAIPITDFIRILNNYKMYDFLPPLANNYSLVLADHDNVRAGDCIRCGACEGVCPQKIAIIDTLERVSKLFDKEQTA